MHPNPLGQHPTGEMPAWKRQVLEQRREREVGGEEDAYTEGRRWIIISSGGLMQACSSHPLSHPITGTVHRVLNLEPFPNKL